MHILLERGSKMRMNIDEYEKWLKENYPEALVKKTLDYAKAQACNGIDKELLNTLRALCKRDDAIEVLNTLNIIANLFHELGNTRITAATYERTFKHGKLILTVSYGEKHAGK